MVVLEVVIKFHPSDLAHLVNKAKLIYDVERCSKEHVSDSNVYSGSPPYGHPVNTATPLLRPPLFGPAKSHLISCIKTC